MIEKKDSKEHTASRTMIDYAAFRDEVKEQLSRSLAVWEISDADLEAYVTKEEDQIKNAFQEFLNPDPKDTRSTAVRFTTAASTVAFCLDLCYE